MQRREFLGAIGGAAALSAQARQKPNFIIIYTDDQGYGDMGCYGSPEMKTPHMDKLAAEGVRFTDWHSNSPVCSPSRASVLTGKYPQHAGIPQILTSKPDFAVPGLRKGETTLSGELKKLGYRTAAIGKWHLGSTPESRPMAQGFDEWFGFYSGWTDYYSHRYYTLGGTPVFHDLWRGDKEHFEDTTYQTEMLAREAKAFLSKQTAQQPFFLYLAFGAPHYPMMAPKKYVDRFPQAMDRDRRMHCAMVAAIDDALGELVALLKSKGLDNNTVIFLQGDNGATLEARADHAGRIYRGGSNGKLRGYKGSLWEGGMRVPGLLRWPARIKPQVQTGIGMSMDILPTFLKWAGSEIPAGTDGVDLSPMILEGKREVHDAVFWDYDTLRAVRLGEWKLMQNYRDGLGMPITRGEWLSNLKDDLSETRDWSREKPEIARQLRDRLGAWKV